MGASILPTTIYKNKIYFLFGKEREIDENPGWSDFGGGTDNNETYIQTAVRESCEELTGFLGDAGQVKSMLSKYGTYNIDFNSPGHNTYRVHIFPMEYDELLPYYYNNNQRFLQKKLSPKIIKDSKIFEKTEIRWFSMNELPKMRSKFRNFYQKIVDMILERKTPIQHFITSSLKKSAKKMASSTKIKKMKLVKKNKTRKNITPFLI